MTDALIVVSTISRNVRCHVTIAVTVLADHRIFYAVAFMCFSLGNDYSDDCHNLFMTCLCHFYVCRLKQSVTKRSLVLVYDYMF